MNVEIVPGHVLLNKKAVDRSRSRTAVARARNTCRGLFGQVSRQQRPALVQPGGMSLRQIANRHLRFLW